MEIELKMPDLATTDSDMEVVSWLVEVGQPIKRGQPLLEVETDKAAMEVEAVATGNLKVVHVHPGDAVSSGQVIAVVEVEGTDPAPANTLQRETSSNMQTGAEAKREPAATPAKKGGMFAKNREAAGESSKRGQIETIPLSMAQRTVARRMLESKQTIPHFYLQLSANAEPLLARRQAGASNNIVVDAFFVNAVGKALKKFERMCYRFEGDHLVSSSNDAVGVAVDRDGELYVISLNEPADKTVELLSGDIRAAVAKLDSGDREVRKIEPANITVTNLGATGVETFTAIVNPPESAILAIGRIAPVPIVKDGKVISQQRVSLTLSVDHRVVNGKYAAEFLREIVEELEGI